MEEFKKKKIENKLIYDVEGFIFDYVQRKESEEKIMKSILSNFILFSKKIKLHQQWKLNSIIGGSGIGKSRFSFEIWNILKNYVSKNEDYCFIIIKEILKNFQSKQIEKESEEIFSNFKKRILGNIH